MPTLTREQLYALVWTEAIQKIAPRYGLSDRGFGKAPVSGDNEKRVDAFEASNREQVTDQIESQGPSLKR